MLAEVCVLYASFAEPDSTCVFVSPVLSQSRRVYKQLLKSIGGEGSEIVKSANSTLLEIEFTNGSQILFRSAEQKENLRGITVKGLLVIDEAAFIQDDIFEILYPTCDANHAKILIISTPLFMSGEFFRKYTEGLSSTYVKSYNWSLYDTSKYLPPEKLEYYRQTMSPLRFRSEYEGEFIAEGSYIMGNISNIIGELSTEQPLYGGLDWGNGGENDYTALILLDKEAKVTAIYYRNNLSPTEQIDYFSSILQGTSLSELQVELNSIGTVYKDMLQKKVSTNINGFNTTNESKRTIIEQLITAIQTKAITIPNDPELINQLQHYEMEKTKTGYTYNGHGAHDDLCIALALAYDSYLRGGGGFSIAFA